KFILKIQRKTEIYQLTMTENCVITANYKKRATMADKFPMTLEISVDKESKLIDPFENIGKGVLTLTREGSTINVVTEGKIKVELKETVDHNKLSIGSSIVLGSLIITVADLV
ncbi:MAG: hypothetical protein J5897_04610, partial [Candidatus Methanomethylophilus sp.]|nr:hypothetical protein [Methanomethylophilus sp.]